MIKKLIIAILILGGQNAYAGELVFSPKSGAFGDNPSSSNVLLQSAISQNNFKDPATTASSSGTPRSLLTSFQESLQRTVLRKISESIIDNAFGEDGQFQSGTFDAGDFSVSINTDDPGEIVIETIEDSNGNTTTITIPVSF